MKDRDPIKDQHPELLIGVGLIVMAIGIIGMVYGLVKLFGIIFFQEP